MSELVRRFDAIDIYQWADAIEEALKIRRACLDRVAELKVQSAYAAQMEAEARRARWCASHSLERDEGTLSEELNAKAATLDMQAVISRERAKQAEMELAFYVGLLETGPKRA